jgi:hypothetical protein
MLQREHNESVKYFKHFKNKSLPRKESIRKILVAKNNGGPGKLPLARPQD